MISADQELFHELKLQKAKRSVVEIAIARLALLATAIVLSLSLFRFLFLSLPISVSRSCFFFFSFYSSSRFLRGGSHSEARLPHSPVMT